MPTSIYEELMELNAENFSHKSSLGAGKTRMREREKKIYMKILLIYFTLYKLLTFPMAFENCFYQRFKATSKK